MFIETNVVKILYLNALRVLPNLPCSNPLVNKNGLGLIQSFTVRRYQAQSVGSSVDGHLDCFRILTVMNHAAVNARV